MVRLGITPWPRGNHPWVPVQVGAAQALEGAADVHKHMGKQVEGEIEKTLMPSSHCKFHPGLEGNLTCVRV